MLNDLGSDIDEEFLQFFMDEASEVIVNLKIFVENFQGLNDLDCFEKYGQQVDRIMGAAYTLSLNLVGDLAKMGKELGYKATQITEISKLLVIQSLLSQLASALEEILIHYKNQEPFERDRFNELLERLKKASSDLGNLRASVSA